ncbi:MAG TPA: aspartate kinase [Candidatus Saccharimonadales bacterium]|nr:aspartate kinase [Candidatus Saccharimonadales bacterium]
MSPEQQQSTHNVEEVRSNRAGKQAKASWERTLGDSPSQEVVAFKFGGSSLAGAERMRHAAALVREAAQVSPIVVVVSAMKGVTNRLLEIGQLLAQTRSLAARTEALAVIELHLAVLRDLNLPARDHEQVAHELELLSRDLLHETPSFGHVTVNSATYDRLASFGERFASRLFAAALLRSEVSAVPVASSDFVVTCDTFREARPDIEYTRHRGRQVLLPLLQAGIVPVITGFIGATPDGRITTLGRNSSDYSGALIAHVVDAAELVIWTDVDGVYTTNPKESDEAKLLHELSYDEAHALAANGAKVIHPHVLPLAAQSGMTVWIRNTFKPQARGTRIGAQANGGAA